MDDQYKKMLEQLAEIRKKHRQVQLYLDQLSLQLVVELIWILHHFIHQLYHFGGNKSRRILKVKKILKNIKENDTK